MSAVMDDTELQTYLKQFVTVLSPAEQTDMMRAVGQVMGATAEGLIPPYPEQSRKPLAMYYTRTHPDGKSYKSKFKSAKQQGYVMHLAAMGKIPYNRSGDTGKSITSQVVEVSATSVTAAVGTNKKNSGYVIGRGKQSHYHQGNWWVLEDKVEAGLPQINRAAFTELMRQINVRLK